MSLDKGASHRDPLAKYAVAVFSAVLCFAPAAGAALGGEDAVRLASQVIATKAAMGAANPRKGITMATDRDNFEPTPDSFPTERRSSGVCLVMIILGECWLPSFRAAGAEVKLCQEAQRVRCVTHLLPFEYAPQTSFL